ncbi:Gfo/Idh/MocA family protein [Nonomuraea sp. SYSU D8015]|uniref:Gfo/Idh/MocA family protein n=1 Tax=Nonomuraea sp. SYSU D8015 TaxID=2593644 RepID=UPI0016610ACA|nr:Gfo/Idh/MocA family oxidoreductase [Nonomuraea sp. SYSU D8015]
MSLRPTGQPLRIGVLGCADIVWRRALPAMGLVEDVEVVAIASRQRAKAERFAARFGGESVEGYARLLERDDVDVVYVALPTGLHHQWTLRALKVGKHVLVEKSFATSHAEAEEMLETARAHGLRVTENFAFVHHRQHEEVRRLIAEGCIGEPHVLTGEFGIPPRDPGDIRYRADLGGGALLDVGVYPLRAAQMFLDSGVSVLGSTLRMDERRGIDLGGTALLGSDNGFTAQLTFSFEASYRSTYSIWGSSGRITLERAFSPPASLSTVVRLEREGGVKDISVPPDDQFANAVRAFARSVREGADPAGHRRALLQRADLLEQIRNQARRFRVR